MTEDSPAFLSFIIPAYNEQGNIGITLQSLLDGNLEWPYEIIVVDHNSTDNTAMVAADKGASVIKKTGGTIASVRNVGVNKSSGDIIVFLDADVSLTSQWFRYIGSAIEELQDNPLIITGSFCTTPGDDNWIERFWFNNLVRKNVTGYLGTGHMIVKRELFELINGFDEELSTGEDYSFCMKALKNGGSVVNNSALRVIHRDYPKTAIEFINREAWHGTGDVTSLKTILQSKVAMVTLVFIVMHAVFLLALALPFVPGFLAIVPIVGLLALLLISSAAKYASCGFLTVIINSIIFYLYYIGRSISFIKIIGVKLDGHKR